MNDAILLKRKSQRILHAAAAKAAANPAADAARKTDAADYIKLNIYTDIYTDTYIQICVHINTIYIYAI